jgi:uncharacterized protein YbcI
MGRGPEEVKTYIINDIILVRLKGVLTIAEKQLSKKPEGKNLIKQTRLQLLETARHLLETIIENLTGIKVLSLHSDISTSTGERIIVFIMTKNVEFFYNK